MISWLLALIAQFKILVLAGLSVLVLFAVAEIFHKSRSVVASGVVLFLGAGLVWAANNITVIQDKVGKDVTTPGALIAPSQLRLPASVALAGTRTGATAVVYRFNGGSGTAGGSGIAA
jgi:hypothetical protein